MSKANESRRRSSGASRVSDFIHSEPRGKIINTTTQRFDEVRNSRGFVDHTRFIQSFLLRGTSKLAIFAPRRFGKSTHLDMVKKFLEIDIDGNGSGRASSTVQGPAKERRNYKLFEGTHIIADDKRKYLVEDHLGKHPVIHLDFKVASIDSVEAARMHCRWTVHNAYLEHPYLKFSDNLVPNDKEGNATTQLICKKWSCDERFKTQDLMGCLKNLTRYLYNHFNGAKIYILVDEVDAINASALRILSGSNLDDKKKKLEMICNILADMLGSVTKGYDEYVAGALITGVSHAVSGLSFSPLMNNFTVVKFLDGDKVSPREQDSVVFYGATETEVKNLIEKLVLDKQLLMFEDKDEFLNDTHELDADKIMANVVLHYNSYFDLNGSRVFCLWSVLQYLESGDPKSYWTETNSLEDLCMILKCGEVAHEIMKLMRWELIQFKRYHEMNIRDLVKLYEVMAVKHEHKVVPVFVFNFLIDQGCLSYQEGGRDEVTRFKLPNAEIRAVLSKMIGDVVQRLWEISTTSCTRLIEDITSGLIKNERLLQEKMSLVYRVLSEILKPLEEKNLASMNEARMLCTIYKILDDVESFDIGVNLRITDTEGKCLTLDRPAFLMIHRSDKKCSILWEIAYNRHIGKDVYSTSLYALQEARGIVATKYGKTNKYMTTLKNLGREVLVIGLSMDIDMKLSIAYAVGMEKKIVYMSEKEHILYPTLYQTYNPIMVGRPSISL